MDATSLPVVLHSAMDCTPMNEDIGRVVNIAGNSSSATCSPTWQMDLLMQKLRQRSKGSSLVETAKNVRNSLMERRCNIDATENQKNLDQLQQAIQVTSLQTMVEKLEMVTRQQGLKFTPGTTGNVWFIASDMFYLEILIDSNGVVQDVKIQHEGKAEQQGCPEIVQALRDHQFDDLSEHLQGFVSIYHLNADKKAKSKVFIALQALETDLSTMSSTYTHQNEMEEVVLRSLLGLLQPRKGGHPVKLVFYVSPYEFLDVESKKSIPGDLSTILEKQLGITATVSVQAFSSQKLQMSTIVSISRTPDGKCIPRYGSLNATNSTWLQACFTVNLQNAIPACRELLQSIQTTTSINFFDSSDFVPLLNLITRHASNDSIECTNDKGFYVTLPDQTHSYFMTETNNLEGLMISSIPFTLASQLPQVISALRKQLAFNTLVGSCVRVDSKRDPNAIVFEINPLSFQNLTVSFQHPLEDALVTLEFDLRDVIRPQCHLHAQLSVISTSCDVIPTLEEYACKVVHRTMSIPVTLRAVIRRWQALRQKLEQSNPNFNLRVGSSLNPNAPTSQPADFTCGAESERVQNQQQPQSQQIPGMVMNWANMAAGCLAPNSSFTISPVNPIQTTFPNQIDLVSPYVTLSNFQNLNQLNFNSTMVNMLASQISNQQQGQQASVLMNLLDQVGHQNRRRKRKIDPGVQSTNMPMPRPSPSPSPKSPRLPLSAKRRPSDSSDESSPRVPTPTTPSNLNLDGNDSRWNIDITPVGQVVDTTFSKMLSSLSSDAGIQHLEDSDIEIETEIQSQSKFPLKLLKKGREVPKRSMSLDSTVKDNQNPANSSAIQNLFDNVEGFKPLVTPSLSITPVSGNSSVAVNSILASMRPGIEIIPLPNHVSIPHSITVTPILPKPNPADKLRKLASDEPDGKPRIEGLVSKKSAENRKRKIDEALSAAKSLAIGGLQMKPISKPCGMGSFKRSISASPSPSHRTVLPKTTGIASSGALALTKAVSGGKPSISTLKSVSGSPSSSGIPISHQGITKPKVGREKMKPGPLVGPLSKIQKLQSPPTTSLAPKLEPIQRPDIPGLSPVSTLGFKSEHLGVKGDILGKVNSSQKPAITGTPCIKKCLSAVIDKLKSTAEDGTRGKLDICRGSCVTDPAMKPKLPALAPAGLVGVLASGTLPGSEYMIKPGLGGPALKLTINKTKGMQSKDKIKGFGSKAAGNVPGLKKGLTPNRIPSPKLLSPGSVVTKKPKSDGIPSGQIKSPSMKGSPTGGNFLPKPKPEGELDLTKKLFMPGAAAGIFDGPKFDTKFQIPKKSRSGPTPPIPSSEKVEDLSLGRRDKDNLSESPPLPINLQALTVPIITTASETESQPSDPPKLFVAVPTETDLVEKMDELPPILSIEVSMDQLPPPSTNLIIQPPLPILSNPIESDYISPESPDPIPGVEDLKSTPTIPTTPVNIQTESSPPSLSEPTTTEAETPSLPPDDEDRLVMDLPSERSQIIDDGSEDKMESPSILIRNDDGEVSMPPPSKPLIENTPSPATLPPSVGASPSPNSTNGILATTAPAIVSVHIVHSPQPNSPLLLRSPLVIPSPHSEHPSPYTVDDELMDAALLG